MNTKRMTWEEIKKAYPKQVVGLVDCEPQPVNFKTAIVKYTNKTMPYDEMVGRAIDGEISLRYTAPEEDMRIRIW